MTDIICLMMSDMVCLVMTDKLFFMMTNIVCRLLLEKKKRTCPACLQAMPKPSNPAAALAAAGMTEEDALDAAIAQSLGLSGSPDENGDVHGAGPDGAAPPPEAGVSFANIAKMGFAATGPKLSPGAPEMGE